VTSQSYKQLKPPV